LQGQCGTSGRRREWRTRWDSASGPEQGAMGKVKQGWSAMRIDGIRVIIKKVKGYQTCKFALSYQLQNLTFVWCTNQTFSGASTVASRPTPAVQQLVGHQWRGYTCDLSSRFRGVYVRWCK